MAQQQQQDDGSCTLGTDCESGFCCDNACLDVNEDYNYCGVSGINWCRSESGNGNYNAWNDGSSAGTICDNQEIGGPCSTAFNCKGHNVSVAEPGVYCCEGSCEKKQKDWANQWYCPHECKSGIFGADGPGSCSD